MAPMAGEGCFDDRTALSLIAGDVAAAEREALEQHIEQCDDCMARLMALERAGASSEDGSPEDGSPDGVPTMFEAGVTAGAAERTLPPGELVDHFEIVRLIGRGGMGEVYLAVDSELGREVALKMIAPDMVGSPEAMDQFRTEARATAKLNHSNIVTIHAIGRYRGAPYVALEYIEGETLRERLRGGPLAPAEAMRIARAICEGVAEAHARGVLHRDLKPNNIILGDDERVCVVDFGLAKIGDGEGASSGGTPLYMAPEQWRGDTSSAATDVWALGVMLVELFCGRHPFVSVEERDVAAVAATRARETVADGGATLDPKLVAAIPKPLRELARRCLSDDRPTAAELVGAFQHTTRAPSAAAPDRRAAFAVVGLLSALLVGAWVVSTPEPSVATAMTLPSVSAATPSTDAAASAAAVIASADSVPPEVESASPDAPSGAPGSASSTPGKAAPRFNPPATCEKDCAIYGRCQLVDNRCVATSDAMCPCLETLPLLWVRAASSATDARPQPQRTARVRRDVHTWGAARSATTGATPPATRNAAHRATASSTVTASARAKSVGPTATPTVCARKCARPRASASSSDARAARVDRSVHVLTLVVRAPAGGAAVWGSVVRVGVVHADGCFWEHGGGSLADGDGAGRVVARGRLRRGRAWRRRWGSVCAGSC